MKYYILSDLHIDFYEAYAVKPARYKMADPAEDVTIDTLEYIWNTHFLPEADAIILAGDYSNDYLRFSRMIPWIAKKYPEVYLVLGNHDLTCRGATDSKSNLQFTSSEQKIAKMKEICDAIPNVHFLDGNIVNSIGGCMGMCDFKCEAPTYGLDAFTAWKRNWYDGKYWRYFRQVPSAIWNYQEQLMMNIVKQKPKIMVTHFVPYELGVPFDFRNDPWNYVFYFHAEPFLEEMENDSYWICGHTHGRRIAEYVNSKGNVIHIRCNAFGYPNDYIPYCDIVDYTGEKIERTQAMKTHEDFIIEV
jgi:metallophosphoesterase superfamily enzyme